MRICVCYLADMSTRGKQGSNAYATISARIPKDLRKQVKHKLIDTELTTDDLIESLLKLWVKGDVVLNQAPLASATMPDDSAARLKAIRSQLKMSQRQMAKHLGLHHTSIGKYERSRAPADILQKAESLLSTDN